MGQLVERQIPTLFGGVSRQPTMVRRPNQMQEVTNALSSVVSGGFEKRPATQLIADLTALDTTKDYATHKIDRDATEQLLVYLSPGEIIVYDSIAGTQKTVTIGDTKHYHVVEAADIDATGVLEIGGVDFEEQLAHDSGETTFDWGWQLSDATTGRFRVEGSADGAVWNTISAATVGGAASGTFSTTIDAVATGDHNYIRVYITTGMATAADTLTLWATFQDLTYLLTGIDGPEDFAFQSVADFTFICNRTLTTRMAEATTGTITDVARDTAVGTPPAGLVAPTGSGLIYKIIEDNNEFTAYYVIDDATENLYVETVNPNGHNTFDSSTLPHQLVRNADGTFTYSEASYDDRGVGDETLVENPPFIGKVIKDLPFFRNRLAFLADENVYTSRSADALIFWPEKALATLDTDPIDRAATANDVNILQWGTVFRKLLFCTAARAQFELGSTDKFTPDLATFDQATSYVASVLAKPRAMGDVLYFPSPTPSHAIMYEYFFNEASLSNTASDISKHVIDYIPNAILSIATDAASGTVFVLTTGEQNSVFVYKTFFDGNNKIQSAWGKYTFGATEAKALVHGIAVFSGFLVLTIERQDGNIYLEQMPIEREPADDTMGYIPLMDQRELVTGVYDSGTDLTTWTTTWGHEDDCEVVLGPNFTGGQAGRRMTLAYPTDTTMTSIGDHSADVAYVGRTYTMTVELSKLFMREDGDSPAIISGRLQIRDIIFQYEESGYFIVRVTPLFRDSKDFPFNGRVLGSASNVIGAAAIEPAGSHRAQVYTNGETGVIEIINDTPFPSVITAAAWRGFFNEIARQG